MEKLNSNALQHPLYVMMQLLSWIPGGTNYVCDLGRIEQIVPKAIFCILCLRYGSLFKKDFWGDRREPETAVLEKPRDMVNGKMPPRG